MVKFVANIIKLPLTSSVKSAILVQIFSDRATDMAQNAPGQHYRKGISIIELFKQFPDDATAEKWFENARWADGVRCAHCDSDRVSEVKHPTMPYRCRDCRKHFSAKTNSLMHNSPIGYQKWVIAIYLITTNLKGISSMKLHRELDITQSPLAHDAPYSARHTAITQTSSTVKSK